MRMTNLQALMLRPQLSEINSRMEQMRLLHSTLYSQLKSPHIELIEEVEGG